MCDVCVRQGLSSDLEEKNMVRYLEESGRESGKNRQSLEKQTLGSISGFDFIFLKVGWSWIQTRLIRGNYQPHIVPEPTRGGRISGIDDNEKRLILKWFLIKLWS